MTPMLGSVTRIARLSLVFMLLGLVVGVMAPNALDGQSVLADGDDNDDRNEGEGNSGHGGGRHDGYDTVTVVVAPDVTPVTAQMTSTTTASTQAAEKGTLRIEARVCTVRPAEDADWEAACTFPVIDGRFELEAHEGLFAGWHRHLQTNESGSAMTEELPVGRYALVQSQHDWCHAESDRVEANGELVIERGQVTTVWVFNCEESPLGS